MTIHIGPRTISAVGGSIKRVGNYRIHTFPSELVTDGLVLNLDAGDPRSYPGSGTVWTDLSGNGNTATGIGTSMPSYDNANGGSLVFDGINDYIDISTALSNQFSSKSITVSTFAKISSVVSKNNLLSFNGAFNFFLPGSRLGPTQQLYWDSTTSWVGGTTTTWETNRWYNLVWTIDSLRNLKFYIDGVLDYTSIIAVNFSPTTNAAVRIGLANAGEYATGSIAMTHIYNRALSAAEVAQNYDALRVRYTSYTNTFTPLCAGNSGKVEVLCVAGGGAGGPGDNGQGGGGGGGAGGLLYNSAFTVNSNVAIGVTVGAGGTGAYLTFPSGGNSSFSSLISIGGGSGAVGNGNAGGSGGGSGRGSQGFIPGNGTVGQGNSGGSGGIIGSGQDGAGGGGGAGSVGFSGIGFTGGLGGSGLLYSISGSNLFYAAGGGGGSHNTTGASGGSGIGGNGATTDNGFAAIPNTGSGGGGGRGATGIGRTGGNGSNGIVIVRYPATDYNVELLIVGGGGGGGFSVGSGGGAGGLIYYSSYPVSAGTKYSVTVGAGSPGMNTTVGTGTAASNGGNSIMGPLVAYGGGGGTGQSVGFPNGTGGKSGGSGSGGTRNQNTPGQGVPGQGNAGGRGSDVAGSYGGGGGGGAGSVGGDGSGSGGGNGGIGLAFSITGVSTYYAGGGGGASNGGPGGSGGLGGGGAGTSGANGVSGTVNTGGGGGAGDASGGGTTGGTGGSGIVIIAYQGPQRGIGGTVDTTSRPGYTIHRFTTTGTDIFIP